MRITRNLTFIFAMNINALGKVIGEKAFDF
jgi:hypothetical protein